jgi:hypothetical protein
MAVVQKSGYEIEQFNIEKSNRLDNFHNLVLRQMTNVLVLVICEEIWHIQNQAYHFFCFHFILVNLQLNSKLYIAYTRVSPTWSWSPP